MVRRRLRRSLGMTMRRDDRRRSDGGSEENSTGFEAVLRLDATARHTHFVKRVVDAELVWGLWKDGWALMADETGQQVFPLWPAREYAELCAVADWEGYLAE